LYGYVTQSSERLYVTGDTHGDHDNVYGGTGARIAFARDLAMQSAPCGVQGYPLKGIMRMPDDICYDESDMAHDRGVRTT